MRLRRPRLSLPLLGALLGLAACGDAPRDEGPRPRNLILISVDTLRADHLGCYGYERPTSPHLDRWAASGTLFEQMTAAAPWTVPSHMSMLTGLYTRTHGIDGWQGSLPDDVQTLASTLKAQGFATAAFVNVFLLNKERHFDRGFESYTIVPDTPDPRGATRTILSQAIPWLRAHRDGPYFLFLHFYDVHSDFDPLPEYRKEFERMYQGIVDGSTMQLRWYRQTPPDPPWGPADARHLVDLYDAGIRQFDTDVEELFAFLRGEHVVDDTLVALTADHGEEFLEHGQVMHGRTLHQELVHIPLILVGPRVPAGVQVQGDASTVDVMPTALSLLGVPVPGQCEGIDLSPGWHGADFAADRPVFSEADKWLNQAPGNFRRMIRRGKYTLHYDKASGSRELYDVDADPYEHQDLAAKDPALAGALWKELEAFMSKDRQVDDSFQLSEEERQRLKDLGYF